MKTITDSNFLMDLIAPMPISQFFEEYWGKKMLHIKRNDVNYFNSTLQQEQIEIWLKYSTLTFPTVELMKGNRTNPYEFSFDHMLTKYNNGKQIDKQKIQQLFHDGHSILVNAFSQFIPSLAKQMETLHQLFTGKIQDSLIISTDRKKAFNIHHDKEHVVAFQISGEKEWSFHNNYSKYMRGETLNFPFTPAPTEVLIMQPGDFLYIPPGLRHQTTTLSSIPSMSISIILDLVSGIDFLNKIVKYSYVKYPQLREMIPPYSTLEDKKVFFDKMKSIFLGYFEEVNWEDTYEQLQLENEKIYHNFLEKTDQNAEISLETEVIRINPKAPTIQSDSQIIRFQYLNNVLPFHQIYRFSLDFIEKQTTVFKVKDIFGMLADDLKIDLAKQLIDIGYLKIID